MQNKKPRHPLAFVASLRSLRETKPLLLCILCVLCVKLNAQIKPNGVTAPAPATAVAKPANYPTSGTINYIRTREATAPITTEAAFATAPFTQVKEATQYIDGLGRPIQTIVKQGSPKGGDLVTPQVYDEFGREVYKYLPFVSTQTTGNFITNPFVQQEAFGQSQYPGEQVYYGYTQFEASPLNRPLKSLAPGNSWAGSNRGVSMSYEFNGEEEVALWEIEPSGKPKSLIWYQENQLYRMVTTDEHSKRVVEYKDKDGKVVLKKVEIETGADITLHDGWLCTYYVYDDFGLLRAVIQPKLIEWYVISYNIWDPTLAELNEMCFLYKYDSQLRMISKKVPGAAEVLMVYDQRDRLVLTQDGNMRANNQWLATAYDNFNRPINTFIHTTTNTHAQLISSASTSTSFPAVAGGGAVLSATFYDDYNFVSPNGFPINGAYQNLIGSAAITTPYTQGPWFAMPLTQSSATKGMVTGSWVNVLNTSTKLYSITIYDDYGRAIQAKSTNITGGTDVVTNQGDFSGKPLVTHSQSQKAGTNPLTTTQLVRNTYDAAGRLTQTTHKLNNFTEVIIAKLTYDAMGQLAKKELGQTRASATAYNNTPLETLDYSYNIRGWLKGINKEYLNNGNQYSQDRWFGFELSYDYGFGGAVPAVAGLFNGNISGMIWRNRGSDKQRSYGFAYDNANRLLKGDFNEKQPTDGPTDYAQTDGINFDMKMGNGVHHSSAYDANGNILNMKQWGLKLTTSELIDNLFYSYYEGEMSNRLSGVTDWRNDVNTKLGDFRTSQKHMQFLGVKGAGSIDYTYDANGNLKKDLNKDIGNATTDGIIYNYLNLPQTITIYNASDGVKGTIQYVYDATGNKLQKIVSENANGSTPAKTTTTTYIMGAVYEEVQGANPVAPNGGLQFIGTAEGRVRLTSLNNSTNYIASYDYMLKDHLGNVRTVLTDEFKQDVYFANFEEANQSFEDQLFLNYNEYGNSIVNKSECFDGNAGNQKILKISKDDDNPNNGNSVLGIGKVLKVMAGDKVTINTRAWFTTYEVHTSNSDVTSLLQELVSNFFASGIYATGAKGSVSLSNLQTKVSNQVSNFINTQYNASPEDGAYLNWIFLSDEQLKFKNNSSGYVSVMPEMFENGTANACNEAAHLIQANNGNGIDIVENGYLYIYLSNTSTQHPVYFDDLHITHTRSPLLEETAYYPFGLTMSGISSKAASNAPANKFKFNDGTELNETFDINLYETNFRSLDPQLGRFWQIDALDGMSMHQSLYQFAGNNPISKNDKLGLTEKITDPNHPDYIHEDAPLTEVVVSNKPIEVKYIKQHKSTGLLSNWGFAKALDNWTADERNEWNNDKQLFYKGKANQITNKQNLKTLQSIAQAEKDHRILAYTFLGTMASPLLICGALAAAPTASAMGSQVVRALGLKLEQSLQQRVVNFSADVSAQFVSKNFDITKVNFAASFANTFIGGNVFGSAITNSAIGSTFNISHSSIFGKEKIFQESADKHMNSFLIGIYGNLGGSFLGGAMKTDLGITGNLFGSFINNLTGNLFEAIINR